MLAAWDAAIGAVVIAFAGRGAGDFVVSVDVIFCVGESSRWLLLS